MDLDEYARHDATALAQMVARKEVSPRELGACVLAAVEQLNPTLTATQALEITAVIERRAPEYNGQ